MRLYLYIVPSSVEYYEMYQNWTSSRILKLLCSQAVQKEVYTGNMKLSTFYKDKLLKYSQAVRVSMS